MVIRRTHPPLSTRYTADDGHDVPLGHHTRPSWRGRIHLFALCCFVPAVAALTIATDDRVSTASTAVYGVGLCSMFGSSTVYHRWVHGLRVRAIWRRIDHAAIYAAIAGSATPLALATMDGTDGPLLVAALWATAIPGVVLKLGRWHHGDSLGTALYFVLGIECAVMLPALHRADGVGVLELCIASAAIYVVGAILLGLERPVLVPGVFGYHEVWHAFTVAAAAAHFGAVWQVCT